MQGQFNIWKAINVTQLIHRLKQKSNGHMHGKW
jgi:hypothetical protein